jgi:hypothetical protein
MRQDHVATIRARPKASQRGQGLTLARFPTFPADSKRSETALAGKPAKVALIAVARQITVIANTMIEETRPWSNRVD